MDSGEKLHINTYHQKVGYSQQYYDPQLSINLDSSNEELQTIRSFDYSRNPSKSSNSSTNAFVRVAIAFSSGILVAVSVVALVASISAFPAQHSQPSNYVPSSLEKASNNVIKSSKEIKPVVSSQMLHSTSRKNEPDLDNEPLFLTPLIEEGRITEALKLSRVKDVFPREIESYSGIITINRKYNSNIFFWFLPAEINPETAPLILCIEGGPGVSGLFSLFEQNGPYRVMDQNYRMEARNTSYTKTYNVIYADIPIGSGFSFTDDDSGYARNVQEVADHSYIFLQQFFTLFPDYKSNEFYVTALSYGGKTGTAIAYNIIRENDEISKAEDIINFQGLIIASGVVDILHMSDISEFYYQTGLIDKNTKHDFKQQYLKAIYTADFAKNLTEAKLKLDNLRNQAAEISGYSSGNLLFPMSSNLPNPNSFMNQFAQLNSTRKKIHVGNATFHYFKMGELPVAVYLNADILISQQPEMEFILFRGYRVLFYTGQNDLILLHTKASKLLDELRWTGRIKWDSAPRKKYYFNNQLAGYVKEVDNLSYVMFREAGHVVVVDKPQWAYDIVVKFITGKKFVE